MGDLSPSSDRFARWSLRQQLAAIILLVAVPLNLGVAYAIWSLASSAQDAQRRAIQFTARSVAAAVDAELGKYLLLGQVLARSPALMSGDLETFAIEARRAFEGNSEAWVVVADADGRQILNTLRPAGTPLPIRSEGGRAAQAEAFRTGKRVVSGVLFGPVTGEAAIAIDYPIRNGSGYIRSLVISIKATAFLKLLSAHETPTNWLVGVIDQTGRFVARVPDHDQRVGQLASEGWRATRPRVGIHEFKSIEGDPLVQANALASAVSWSIGIGVKKSQLNAAVWRSLTWALALGAIVSALSITLAVLFARRMTAAIDEVGANARRLLEDDAAPPYEPALPDLRGLWGNLETAVAARKDADQRLRLVMREVNHRSKNLLTVIQSIARQTAASSPHDFLRRFADRLEALSGSQDLLVKSEWKGVDLAELVRSQLGPYRGLLDGRIRANGPRIDLTAAAAQTIGMALHELATNAAKYGALSNDTGTVSIDWVIEPAAGAFTMTWAERGGPPPAPPTDKGFGSTVTGRMVELGLEAKVTADFATDGLVWSMHCLAANLSDCPKRMAARAA